MTFLAITTDTWIVTGLGFGIVVALLFCFIYIMKLMGVIMQKVSAPAKAAEPVEEVKPQVQTATADTDDMVALAYALHLYYNSLHDEDSPRLTVKIHPTAWHIIQ